MFDDSHVAVATRQQQDFIKCPHLPAGKLQDMTATVGKELIG
jgi:hypothetical protein